MRTTNSNLTMPHRSRNLKMTRFLSPGRRRKWPSRSCEGFSQLAPSGKRQRRPATPHCKRSLISAQTLLTQTCLTSDIHKSSERQFKLQRASCRLEIHRGISAATRRASGMTQSWARLDSGKPVSRVQSLKVRSPK